MKSRKSPSRPPRVAGAAAAPARAPTYDDLREIVELLRTTNRFSEFRLRVGDIEVEVKRANGTGAMAAPASAAEEKQEPSSPKATKEEVTSLPPGLTLVRAPMVGTVYRAPAPGAAPFVEVGTRVKADATVCIIEVMKLMNTIPAGCAGVVTHVLAQNAQGVEAGQPLFAIRPE